MKNLLIAACVAAFAATGGAYAQTSQPCDCEDLDTDITAHTTLTEDCYFLQGCVRVTSGFSLTIPAGTVIFADANAELQVERGAWLNVNGTSNNPVVFTTNQLVSNRTPGYWKGITIAGNGVNNINPNSTITLDRNSCNLLAGGATNTDSSGVLRHLQIHYAGKQDVGETDVNGLTLACVGNRTVVENVQVTRSLTNGFAMIGGAVELKYLAGFNNINSDYVFSRGNVSPGQFLLSLRNDPNAYNSTTPQLSNGILIENHPFNPTYATGIQTHPVLSNVSLFGPLYCDEEEETGNITGVKFQHNATGSIYNSFIGGHPMGLFVQDSLTIFNVHSNDVQFAFSSFYQNDNDFISNPADFQLGTMFCAPTISDWMLGMSGCPQLDNNSIPGPTGYDGSICNESYCGTGNRPVFELTENEIGFADFSPAALNNAFFDTDEDGIEYRGAFGETDWTNDWTDWCPLATDYCPELQQRSSTGKNNSSLCLAPNPANGTTYALFNANQTGKVLVNVLDKVSGQVLRNSSSNISAGGAQRIAIPVDRLQTGVYVVKVVLPDGNVLSGQLFVL